MDDHLNGFQPVSPYVANPENCIYQPDEAIIIENFRFLVAEQQERFKQLGSLYYNWNQKLNLISRKDLPNLYERHILHSLGIAKIINFKKGTKILDIGTGGGFPGIPLAIYFPDVIFHLVDSIEKKIRAVTAIKDALGLKNVITSVMRAEAITNQYDFIVGRGVAPLEVFCQLGKGKIIAHQKNNLLNGILYLKGDDKILNNDLKIQKYFLSDYFKSAYFEYKMLFHVAYH